MHSVTTIFHWPITARALGRWEKWFPWTIVILSPPEAHFCEIRVLAQWNVISVWNFWHTLNAATWFICNKKVCIITSLKREISKKICIKFCMEAYSFPSCMVYTAQGSSIRENVYHLILNCSIHVSITSLKKCLVTEIKNLLFFVANDRCFSL